MLVIAEYYLFKKNESELSRQETYDQTPLGVETTVEDRDHLLIQRAEDKTSWRKSVVNMGI